MNAKAARSLAIVLLLQSAAGRAAPVDGLYVVSEFEIPSVPPKPSATFRVAKLVLKNPAKFLHETLRFSTYRPLAPRFTPQGFGEDGGAIDANVAKAGDEKWVEAPSLKLVSIFGYTKEFTSPLKYRVKILRTCGVTAKSVTSKKIVSTGDGVIAIPKIVPNDYTEISRPDCFEESDRAFDLSPDELKFSPAEREEWKVRKKTNAELLEARRSCVDFKPPPGTDFEANLKRLNCPDIGAYATALGMTSFEFDRGKMTVHFTDGRAETFDSVPGFDKTFGHIKTLKPNRCCFSVVRGTETGSEASVVNELNFGLKKFLRRKIEDRVEAESKK